jgi:hypothetical protein
MYRNQLHFQNSEALHAPDQDHQRGATESGACRAGAIAVDLAVLRMQGVEPVPDFFGIAERYVSGELSDEQFRAAIEGLRHRQSPIPFPSPPEPASN